MICVVTQLITNYDDFIKKKRKDFPEKIKVVCMAGIKFFFDFLLLIFHFLPPLFTRISTLFSLPFYYFHFFIFPKSNFIYPHKYFHIFIYYFSVFSVPTVFCNFYFFPFLRFLWAFFFFILIYTVGDLLVFFFF